MISEKDDIHPKHLIVQYFRCADPARQAEIDTCLRNNLLNTHLAAVHLLTEEQFNLSTFPNNSKIVQTVIGERLTFENAFLYANESDPDGKLIWILSNADIYFDESLKLVEWENLDGAVYALTRHDVQADGAIKLVESAFAHGCQDAWFFKSPLRLSIMFTQFFLGVPGCDNRIANEFIQAGYKAINPAYLLRAIHLDLTRETDIWKRDKEYASLKTDESIVKGQVAPPPYQFHIYPVDQLNSDSIGLYQANIRHLSELGQQIADMGRTLLQQSNLIEDFYGQIAVYSQLLEERDRKINSLDQLLAERESIISSLLDSLSWKITAPLRKLLDYIKVMLRVLLK